MCAKESASCGRQVLFVVEGKKTDPKVVKTALEALGVETDGYSILSFGTNLHSLIRLITDGGHDEEVDFAGVELREVLADLMESGKGTLGRIDHHNMPGDDLGDPDWLRTAKITDFFLLFDFDPHASEYTEEDLYRFQCAFVDSAGDLGKLLLSYPMVEACKEACAVADCEFMELVASEPLGDYKATVQNRLVNDGLARFCDLRKYTAGDFATGVSRSVAKANALLDKGRRSDRGVALRDLASACDEVDLPALLKVQQEWYGSRKEVPVVGTGLFFLSIWSRELNGAEARTGNGLAIETLKKP